MIHEGLLEARARKFAFSVENIPTTVSVLDLTLVRLWRYALAGGLLCILLNGMLRVLTYLLQLAGDGSCIRFSSICIIGLDHLPGIGASRVQASSCLFRAMTPCAMASVMVSASS